jgi:hypothetical protein
MSDDNTNTSQLNFQDGRLVERSETTTSSDTDYTADTVTPGD